MTVMNNGLSSGRQGRSFLERMVGAAGLRADIYEEVAADTSATPAAAFVIIVSSIAGGIGALGTTGIVGLVVGYRRRFGRLGRVGLLHLRYRD